MDAGRGAGAGRRWKAGQSRWRMLLPPLVVALSVIAAAAWVGSDEGNMQSVARDGDLCPVDANRISGDAVFLLDLTKPLVGMPAQMPGRRFRDLTLELERDTEIRVYLLAGSADAPLALLDRLCKPFDAGDIQIAAAKDHDGAIRDCDNLPAQMARDLRRSAGRFCGLRMDLEKRLDTLVAKASQQTWVVARAYLTEAIDQIQMAFRDRRGPHRLHVVSDMMQHADWYSHLDLDWSLWDFDDFVQRSASRIPPFSRHRDPSAVDVDVHYLVRDGLTTRPDAADRHRRFWRAYFGGASVAFHDQPPIRQYVSTPAMDAGTDRATPRFVSDSTEGVAGRAVVRRRPVERGATRGATR